MEKPVKHKYLNSVLFTVLFVQLAFLLLRDTIIVLSEPLFLSLGKDSLLYQINGDIARLVIAGLLLLIMPIYFRGKCNFGFRYGKPKLGLMLSLPLLIVPLWNLLQIKVYDAPLVTGTAVIATIFHGIGPGVSEEVFFRGFAVSNLMRIWKDKPNRIFLCMLTSGFAFGLTHAMNVIVTGDILATLVQVVYTSAVGILNGAIYLRSRNIWGVIIMHTLTDITAFLAVFESNATGMDIVFCIVGSLLFIVLALYLIRPIKHAEIDELWEDGWSFGNEDGKRHAGAKVATIVTGVLVVTFLCSIGVMLYQAKMGYDIPFFSDSEKELNKNIQYSISKDRKELTLTLPGSGGEKYSLESSDSESLVLKGSGTDSGSYSYVFYHEGSSNEPVKLVFSLSYGDMPTSFSDYTVTVSFNDDGTISSVGG